MGVTYRYLTNREWGIRYTVAVPRTERIPDPEGTLHHTAGNPMHNMDAKLAFRALNEAAIRDGYWCVAYDILVHEQKFPNGDVLVTIGEGRGPWMSGATLDRNEQTEAICAMGYFHPGHNLSERPSPWMFEGIARAFAWGIQKGWIVPSPNIYGHRDNPAHPGATVCPGDYLWIMLPWIRSRVQQLLQPEVGFMHAFVAPPPNTNLRILDTRGPAGPNHDAYKLAANKPHHQTVPLGADKQFAVVNLLAVEQEAPGFMATWGTGPVPNTSVLNWGAPSPICNEITVPLVDGGFQLISSARTHVIVDLVGYLKAI